MAGKRRRVVVGGLVVGLGGRFVGVGVLGCCSVVVGGCCSRSGGRSRGRSRCRRRSAGSLGFAVVVVRGWRSCRRLGVGFDSLGFVEDGRSCPAVAGSSLEVEAWVCCSRSLDC